jgi:hypothetical protein
MNWTIDDRDEGRDLAGFTGAIAAGPQRDSWIDEDRDHKYLVSGCCHEELRTPATNKTRACRRQALRLFRACAAFVPSTDDTMP